MVQGRRGVLVFVGACAVALFGALYVNKPPNPDQGIFDYIGWVGVQGGRYYLDVAEQNFPGEMLLHELAFRLFGVHFWAYRMLDFVLLLSSSAALAAVLRRLGSGGAAMAGAALYVAAYCSSNAWMAGQRDVVAANLLVLCAYLFLRRVEGAGRWTLVCIGMLAYLALMLRPTYILYVASLPILDWFLGHRQNRTIGTVAGDTALAVTILVACLIGSISWGISVGSWPAFREQALAFNFQAYAAGHTRSDTLVKLAGASAMYLWYLPAAALSILAGIRAARWHHALLLLLGLGLLAPTSALVQNKGFGYHLGALLPVLFGLAGAGVWRGLAGLYAPDSASTRHRREAMATTVAAVLVSIGLVRQCVSLGPQVRYLLGRISFGTMMSREGGGQVGFTWGDMVEAAEYARIHASPSDTILVWGRPVSIYLLAERRASTRFITTGMLVLAKPPFVGATAWVEEFTKGLRERPPKIIFVPRNGDDLDFGAFVPSDLSGPVIDTLRETLRREYGQETHFGSLSAFRRL